jgi:hypothetical protein
MKRGEFMAGVQIVSDILPKDFVQNERQRVFEPDASFARRVVGDLRPVTRSSGLIWDYVPSFARPMVAAASGVLLVLISLNLFYPTPPELGIVDAYLSAEATPAEEWLYWDAEPPEGQDLLIEIAVAESQWSPE